MKAWINQVKEKLFIMAMARRFYSVTRCNWADSKEHALLCYKNYIASEGIKFGDPKYSWDKHAANEIVDTEISYWN